MGDLPDGGVVKDQGGGEVQAKDLGQGGPELDRPQGVQPRLDKGGVHVSLHTHDGLEGALDLGSHSLCDDGTSGNSRNLRRLLHGRHKKASIGHPQQDGVVVCQRPALGLRQHPDRPEARQAPQRPSQGPQAVPRAQQAQSQPSEPGQEPGICAHP